MEQLCPALASTGQHWPARGAPIRKRELESERQPAHVAGLSGIASLHSVAQVIRPFLLIVSVHQKLALPQVSQLPP